MKYLAIDTAGEAVVVAVKSGERVFSFLNREAKSASSMLLPAVDRLLDEAGLTLGSLDFVAATRGPGSFTGIRIGLTTVRMLGEMRSIPVVAVNSLEKLAYNVAGKNATLCAIHAYSGFAYAASYGPNAEEITPPACLTFDELAEKARKEKSLTFVADAFTARKLGFGTVDDPAASLCAAVEAAYSAGRITPPREIEPYYLLDSQAERDLKAGRL